MRQQIALIRSQQLYQPSLTLLKLLSNLLRSQICLHKKILTVSRQDFQYKNQWLNNKRILSQMRLKKSFLRSTIYFYKLTNRLQQVLVLWKALLWITRKLVRLSNKRLNKNSLSKYQSLLFSQLKRTNLKILSRTIRNRLLTNRRHCLHNQLMIISNSLSNKPKKQI